MNNAQNYMNNNPFMDMFKNMDMSKNMWNPQKSAPKMPNMPDMSKMMSQMKQAMQMSQWADMWNKNMKSIDKSKANANCCPSMEKMQSMMTDHMPEKMQDIMKRKAELMQERASSAFDLMKDMSTSSKPKENMAKQTDFAKQAFENMKNDFKELSEMYSESSMEAFEMMSKQFSQSMKKAAKPSPAKAKKKQK